MKKVIILLTMFSGLLSTGKSFSQNVAINADGTAPHVSAMLDVKSITKGLLIPRMTTAQRMAIPTPAQGLKVFDITTKSFHFFNGTAWIELASVNTSNYWLINGNNIYNNNAGFVGIGTPAPTSRLHIISNEASVPLRIQNKLATGYAGMQFHNHAGTLMGQLGFANATAPALANSFYAGSIANVPFIFTTTNLERMRISNTGYVGIGTIAPTSRLHIIGNEASVPLRIQNNLATGFSGMQFHNSAGALMGQMGFANASAPTLANSFYAGTIGSFPFIFTTANLERMRISNTGYIGIGTIAPTSRLHIIGNEASVPLRIQNNLATGLSGMQFHNSAGVLMGQMGFANASVPTLGNSFYAGSIGTASFILTTKNLERMRIDSTGNIGIGTAGAAPNASAMLDIKSTNKGLLIPRMTLAQRNVIALPATSLMIFQTDNTPGYYYYSGASWIPITSGGSTNSWSLNSADIFNNNTGNVGVGTGSPSNKFTVQTAYDKYGITHTDGTIKISTYIGKESGAWFGTESNHKLHIYTNAQGTPTPNITFNPDFYTDIRGKKPIVRFYDETTAFNLSGDIRSNERNLEIAAYKVGTVLTGTPGNLILQADDPSSEFLLGANAGNVGIGTTVPTEKLTVQTGNGYGMVHTNGTISLGTWLSNSNAYTPIGGWFGTKSNHPLSFFTNGGGARMTILQNGNIGIGTVSPSAKLHINQDGEALRLSGNNAHLSFFNGASYKGYLWSKAPDDIELGTSTSNSLGNVNLSIRGTPHLSIRNSGYIGVGTTAPADKLTVLTETANYGLTHTDGAITVGSYVGFGAGWLGTKTNHPLNFFTNDGNPQMAIQPDGQVSIGKMTVHPNGKVSINGGLANYLEPVLTVHGELTIKEFGEWTLDAIEWPSSPPQPRLVFFFNGSGKAYVDIDGDWNTFSDISLKENISAYKPVLENIKNLKVSTYRFKSNAPDSRSIGLIAQNVAQYFPEIVSETQDKDGRKLLGIAYGKTGVLALKAIQEQQVIIETLQKQVEAAKAEIPMQIGKQQAIIETQQRKIDELERRLAALEKFINK